MNIGYSSNSIITAIPEKLTCTASIINEISVTHYTHFIYAFHLKKTTLCQKNIEADNIMKKFLIRMLSFQT